MNAVSLKVNQDKLFQNLRHAFSASAMLGELLQNARRAKATLIQVTYDEPTETLVVEDNGTGIGNLQNLLTAATSGWDEATADKEKPFGLGFLSVVYACKNVTVETVGQEFSVDTENLLNGGRAEVRPNHQSNGTRITLRGYPWVDDHRKGLFDDNNAYRAHEVGLRTVGFPVPVVFNGAPMPNPLAMLGQDYWVSTDVGEVWIKDLLNAPTFHSGASVFVQGLPIQFHHRPDDGIVVHLNNSFAVKLPDRKYLVDPDKDSGRVEVAVRGVARQMLLEKKAEIGAAEFILRWGNLCGNWHCQDLLDDIDCVPVAWFMDWTNSAPGFDVYGDHHYRKKALENGSEVVTREMLQSEGVYDMPDDAYGNDNAFAAQCWLAFGEKWTIGNTFGHPPISANHWLHGLKQELEDADFAVTVEGAVGIEQVNMWGDNASHLGVAERILITHVAKAESYEASEAITEDTLYVTTAGVPGGATRLLSDYMHDDRYDEGEEYVAGNNLQQAFHRIVATDPANLFATILRTADGVKAQPKLANATMIVEFDENGSFRTVREAEPSVMKYFAVTGRIPGDDEDVTHLFQADDREHAIEQFKDVLWSGKDEDHEDRVGTRDSEGADTYINSVVVSDSPITNAQ